MDPVGARPGEPGGPTPPLGPRAALPTPVAVATVLTALQGGLAVLIGLVLVGRGRRIRRLGIGLTGARLRGAGLVVLLGGAALIVVAVGLARLRPWARIGAFVVEGISVLSGVVRLGGARPGAAIVGIVISVAVIATLLTATASSAFAAPDAGLRRPPPGGG